MKRKLLVILLALMVTGAMLPLSAYAEPTVIDSVHVNITVPKTGAKIKAPTVDADANYVISEFEIWGEDFATEEELSYEDDDFPGTYYYKAGYTYEIDVDLEPKEGYVFDTSVSEDDIEAFNGYISPNYFDPAWCEIYSDELELESYYFGNCLKLSFPKTEYVYTGKAIKPSGTIKGLPGEYFNLSYKNNKAVGTATVTSKEDFNGNDTDYMYMPKATFKIVPKKAAIKSLTVGTKKVTVKMNSKVSATGGTKYKIAYKVKGASTWKYTTTTAQSKTIKNLKKGKTYQIKVQAMKGDYKGSWSAIKTTKKIK